MELIDTHCHLPSLSQQPALEGIINRARQAGIVHMINIGTSIVENTKGLEVSRQFPDVSSTAAIYPHKDQDRSLDFLGSYLSSFIQENRSDLVGIGECGIDISGWEGGRSVQDQLCLFEMQANLAKEFDLPLIVHNRRGDDCILDILQRVRPSKGVIHCFSSTWEFGQKVLDLGFHLSFSGFITRMSRKGLLEIVQRVPLDRFLIETDSPYIIPDGAPGKKNEPKYVRLVAEKVAEARNMSLEAVGLYSTENARKLFGI